jgi:hypothetical protein
MEEKGTSDDVLFLDNELIVDTESGGEGAIEFEEDVLLLTQPLAPEPVVKKIDVGPRISRYELRESRATPDRSNDTGWHIVLPPKQGSASASEPPPIQMPSRSETTPDPGSSHEIGQSGSGDSGTTELAHLIAEARVFATEYGLQHARTRKALYAALGRTFDITFYADNQPAAYSRLIEEAGLTSQDRAPYTPVIKLVFGPDYDKARITEFAAAIAYGRRRNVPAGSFSDFLMAFDGGLKAAVGLERLMRKGEDYVDTDSARNETRPAIARKLRMISPQSWADLSSEGDEFALLMARRLPDGSIAMVGEVPRDIALLEKAARSLLANLGRKDENVSVRNSTYTEVLE